MSHQKLPASLSKMETALTAPLDVYRKYVLNMIQHDFSATELSNLLDAQKTNIREFAARTAPLETQYPNSLRFDIPKDVIASLNENLIAYDKEIADRLVALTDEERTFSNAFGENLRSFLVDGLDRSISFLAHVSSDKEIRDASNAASVRASEYMVEASSRKDVFEAVKKFVDSPEYSKLSGEHKRFVDFWLRDGRRSGLELEGEQRERMLFIKKRLSSLSIDFSKNLGEEDTRLLFKPEELDGLSASQLSQFPKKHGPEQDPSEEPAYLEVSLKYPDYIPCMESCIRPETREKLSAAFNSRCMEQNSPIMEEMVDLRAELAELLGYPTHAAFVQEIRMAKNPETVLDFLDDLNEKLTPSYEKEIDELLEIKRADCEKHSIPCVNEVTTYDRAYLSNLYEKQKFSLDRERIAEYFPLETVTKGLFEIYEKLLGLKFKRAVPGSEDLPDPKAALWHEEVELYNVFDADSGSRIGQFYMDLFPRPGKYGHAAVFGLVRGGEIFGSEERQLPVCALVCNFPRPVTDGPEELRRPSLLPHKDVVTFFHEFGHAMHQVCTEVKVPRFSGTSVERDFVEAPSQMLENWCYEPAALDLMNKHYKTGEKLSLETIEQLQKSALSLPGVFNKRQLTFGLLDQRLHNRPPPPKPGSSEFDTYKRVDTAKLFDEVQQEVMNCPAQPNTNFVATFNHLAGGYDATYYGYLWAEVFAADMFITRFKNSPDGVLDENAGRDYRKWILAKGGSQDASELLRGFLNREPNKEAFLKLKGL